MALFKEIKCAHCGKKTSMLSRTQLMDNEYVCGSCTSGIPQETMAVLYTCTKEDFSSIRNFFDVENKQREKLFKTTDKYKCVHLDREHELLYLDNVRPKMYFSLFDLEEFDLTYVPTTAKEGLLSDKVNGDVHLNIRVNSPPFARKEVIAKDVKTTGEIKGLIRKKLEYHNPKGIDEINLHVSLTMHIDDFHSLDSEPLDEED